MAILKHKDEITGEWIEITVSPEEFEAFKIHTDISINNKADKTEIESLKGSVEFADVRLITFIVNNEVMDGVQSAHIPFLFDGDIQEINAYCARRGTKDTFIRVEKSDNMQLWNSISTNTITIQKGNNFDDKSHILFNKNVKKGDIFRINVEESGGIHNLTVNIKIKIKNFAGIFLP